MKKPAKKFELPKKLQERQSLNNWKQQSLKSPKLSHRKESFRRKS